MFLGTRDEGETQAIQVMRDTKTGMLFAHHVPKKGMSNVHGAREIIKDVERLGYDKIILRSDGEAALKSIQAEVARIREKETVLENSPVGDSKANSVAERAVQAFGEQFRVIREGLQQRLQVRIPGNHPLTSWMTEHSADLLNKYQCGEDGRTAYRRWKGKDFQGQVVEFGKKVHHRNNVKGENARNKMDGRWHEGCYLGRTGSAWIGTSAGVIKGSVIRRKGAHRRWDQEGVLGVRGMPWNRVPAAEDEHPEIIIEPLPEAERRAVPPAEDHRRSTSSSMGSQRNVLDVAFFCPERLKGVMGAMPKSAEREWKRCSKKLHKGEKI